MSSKREAVEERRRLREAAATKDARQRAMVLIIRDVMHARLDVDIYEPATILTAVAIIDALEAKMPGLLDEMLV